MRLLLRNAMLNRPTQMNSQRSSRAENVYPTDKLGRNTGRLQPLIYYPMYGFVLTHDPQSLCVKIELTGAYFRYSLPQKRDDRTSRNFHNPINAETRDEFTVSSDQGSGVVPLAVVEPIENGSSIAAKPGHKSTTKGNTMPNRVTKDEGSGCHRLDRGDVSDSPARKSLRSLKLTDAQNSAVRQLLASLAESDDIVEGFFQDCAELNTYTALMILEGYEQDGFYKRGSANALHKLLSSFVQSHAASTVVRHNFNMPSWASTPEKQSEYARRERMSCTFAKPIEKIKRTQEVEAVKAEKEEDKPVRHCTIIQFPGLPKK